MLLVPLSLFATLGLVLVLAYMLRTRDFSQRSNVLFTVLVGLYALQSLLLTLRWGYANADLGPEIALLAPALPICAYLAYRSLIVRLSFAGLWPVTIIVLNWAVLFFLPALADGAIMMTFLCFGMAILLKLRARRAELAFARIEQAENAARAMMVTGMALVASALVDMFVFVDFARTGGQNVGSALGLVQVGFLLFIGVLALWGQSGGAGQEQPEPEAEAPPVTEEDEAIIARLETVLNTHKLHRDTDLSLRKLARRLGLPDRRLSQAINKTQNKSLSQYINGFRVRDACELLSTTDQTILQVSMASGFLSKSNFNREFLRVTGQTPSQWRNAAAGVAAGAD